MSPNECQVNILLLQLVKLLILGQEKKSGKKKTYCLHLTHVELRTGREGVGDLGLHLRASLSLLLLLVFSDLQDLQIIRTI